MISISRTSSGFRSFWRSGTGDKGLSVIYRLGVLRGDLILTAFGKDSRALKI